MSNVNAPTKWMDRLSDAVGAAIPGGSQLSPRHPVRVSVVMGLCGVASGWLSALFGLVVVMFFFPKDSGVLMFASSGLGYGIVVLIPWILWSSRSGWWILLLVPYAFVVQLWLSFLAMQYDGESWMLPLFFWGFAWAASLGGIGMYLQRRCWFLWLLAMALLTGCFFPASMYCLESMASALASLLPTGPLKSMVTFGWIFSAWNAFTAVWMGILLWDRLPQLLWVPSERHREQEPE